MDQALRLVDILIWPALVLTIACVFRRQLQALVGRVVSVTFPGGFIVKMTEEHALEADSAAAQQVDDPAARKAAARLEKAAVEARGAQAEWQRVQASNPEAAAMQIAERAKALLSDNPTWFTSPRMRVSSRAVHFESGMHGSRRVAVGEAGDLALLILRTPPMSAELSARYQDWVRAAELLKAQQVPVSVPPFPESAFDAAGAASSPTISWTEF